jgi:hypothetical protein
MNIPLSRRRFVGAAMGASAALIVSSPLTAAETASIPARSPAMQLIQDWDKTFPKCAKVEHRKVTFKNRYGIELAADLFIPKERSGQPLAALAISGPFGAVKEQASGLYAQNMAERGFVTLAFDPSYAGHQHRGFQCGGRLFGAAPVCGPQADWRHRHLWLQWNGADCGQQRLTHQGRGHDVYVRHVAQHEPRS